MERHNMIDFLENDLRKKDPAGYEKHLKNLFDPDDDESPTRDTELAKAPSQESQEEETSQAFNGRRPPSNTRRGDSADAGSQAGDAVCAKRGCCKKPRFDSVFCSDSCGVLELERDLLRAMHIAGEMHPSLMRT